MFAFCCLITGKSGELAGQLKTLKTQSESAKQELSEYKDKATRILQSKDKLIASLKEGVSPGTGDSSTFSAELEEAKHEKDLLREELRQSKMMVENLRVELQVGFAWFCLAQWKLIELLISGPRFNS